MNLTGSENRQQRTTHLTRQKSMQPVSSTDALSTLFRAQRNLKMKLKLNQLTIALAAMTMSSFCFADSDTANLTVSASVANVCAIGSGTLNFGTLSLGVGVSTGGSSAAFTNIRKSTSVTGSTSAADTSTTVPVICTNDASASVTGALGSNAVGSARKMVSGSNLLTYELYADSARTTVLDASTGAIAYTGTGSTETVTIYGRVAASDIALAKKGNYSDTVALTITYTP